MDRLSTFLNLFNNFHSSIKLTHNISQSEIEFLDICIYKHITHSSVSLGTRVHFKPTNTHRLLHKHSFHPKHTFAGIVKGQLIRFHRLCSDINDFHKASFILFKELRNMGYSIRFLYNIKHQLLTALRSDPNLLKHSAKKHDGLTLIPLVHTYHHASQYICRSLINQLRQFDFAPFKDCLLLKACRRNKNLADLLVRNKM